MDAVATESNSQSPRARAWRGTLSGFSACLVGIGLARFGYTPLLPAIIGAHWFGSSGAAYLGAANLAGYLVGALLARPAVAHVPARVMLRMMMCLATAAFFACAQPVSFLWFFVWRFLSGVSGGLLMVLAAPTVLPHVQPSRRGLAGGLIFMGVGIGIAGSGTLVPLLLREGLGETWVGLGLLSVLLTIAAWRGWPADDLPHATPQAHRRSHKIGALRALYVEYALNAVGLVPHMMFLVDFIARGLGKGVQTGAEYWVLFGLGATVGPILSGSLADCAGFRRSLRLAYLIEACAVLLPALGLGPVSLMASAVIVGAFTPGIVPLVLGRVHELLAHHPAEQKAAWSKATVSFAVLQAAAAYGLSFVFAHSDGDYVQLFIIGAAALMLALVIDLVAGIRGQRVQPN